MGLDPSVYGGGGSSSGDFPDESPLSRERDVLVSSTIGDEGPSCEGSSTGGGGPSAGREVDSGSVTLERSGAGSTAKDRDEKGGGLEKDELDEASEGECGGSAASSSTRESAS
jgi:hypothetical protein